MGEINRRSFLKFAALGTACSSAAFGVAGGEKIKEAAKLREPYGGTKQVRTVCSICSAGCGIVAEVKDGVWVRQEMAIDHPINQGSHCCKGIDQMDLTKSKQRVKYPLKKENGKWKRISWEQAVEEIGNKLLELRKEDGPDCIEWLGSAKFSNEQSYYFRKFAAFWGTNNIDHVARICHSTSVAGAANTWGYGAMTNHFGDVRANSKVIFLVGANSAVANPIGFKHMLQAKDNGAKLIVVDPVYTKSAAKADYFVRLRPGTDIALAYGMLHLIFKNGWEDKEMIATRAYGIDNIRKEAEKWTPQETENVTGVPAALLEEVTRVFATTKPASLAWSLGVTQHSVGSSNTRMWAILQLVLGNVGKPGTGCNIIRGHDNVQGATDMGNLADTLPSYYGVGEGAWKYYCKGWGVDYEEFSKRFARSVSQPREKLGQKVSNSNFNEYFHYNEKDPKEKNWQFERGFTLSKWWQAALGEGKIHSSGRLRALWVQGVGITSMSQLHKIKKAVDKLDLLVVAEPFVNEIAVLSDRKDGVYILPAATQFESEGHIHSTNRCAQWRSEVVKPIWESKPDHEIMFMFAKKFGFYEQYTQSLYYDVVDGELKKVKESFVWPDDATNEVARMCQSIGTQGRRADRLRRHQENWANFDPDTQLGKEGTEVAGEYYGLPWPCWNENHPGTPILYNTSMPIWKGGSAFRNRFGLEHNGVSQIATQGVTIPQSKVKGGYPQITKANIESVLGITLSEREKELMGESWAMDLSGIINKKCEEAGVNPCGNAKARAIVWEFHDQTPLHREPLHSPRQDLVEKYPTFPDQENHWRVSTRYESEQKAQNWSKDFPIIISSMRLVNLSGAGMLERTSKYLASITPEMFANVNPQLAKKYGVADGEYIWVHSPHGTKIKVKCVYSECVTPDRIVMPYNFAGMMQGESLAKNYPEGTLPYTIGESVNTITNYGWDIVTQMAEYNAGLCQIERASDQSMPKMQFFDKVK